MISQYSQADLYSRPPWPFRGAEQISFVFDAHAEGLQALMPPGVTIDPTPEGYARCETRVCWYPWSTFGPFHETYVIVRVQHRGDVYWMLPLIMTDSDVPLAAGREAWGYAKKLAVMDWQWNAQTAGQVLFTMERPAGHRLLTATFRPTRQADPAERQGHPVMSHRHLAAAGGVSSQLVALGGTKALHKDAAGKAQLWAGEGSLDMPSVSSVDPFSLARPIRVHQAFWQCSDFALAPGRVVDDLSPTP
ncbi:MAG: acetoacetate decarboxylase family protein [Actinomycetes bacterium]